MVTMITMVRVFCLTEVIADKAGPVNDYTDEFLKIRRKMVDQNSLEVSRLEKRLSKLTQLLATAPPESSFGLVQSLTGGSSHRKALEQSVVLWEDDNIVPKCPYCHQEFSSYTFRRHHCRLCGKVVCADPTTACSTEIGLNVVLCE